MAKGKSVWGTPVHTVADTAREGIAPGTPRNMEGVIPKQYRGDHAPGHGTPYRSEAGNGPEYSRTVSSDKYGKVDSPESGDQSNPKVNGNGVILDEMGRAQGYTPRSRMTMDSPVPTDAPIFDTSTIRQENIAHLGRGKGVSEAMVNDDLDAIGGVMSRGIEGHSTPSGGEDELIEDDTLRNMGRGGAVS